MGPGGVAGGLEQGGWGLGRVSKGLGGWCLEEGWGLEEAGGLEGGLEPGGTDVRSFVRSLARSFVRSFVCSFGRTEIPPLCSIGHRPLRVRCPKGDMEEEEEEEN